MSEGIKKHSGNKYVRPVRSCVTHEHIGEIDVYCVAEAFGVTDMPLAHAVKKLLCAGLRGKGDRLRDLTEARDALSRAIEMERARTTQEGTAPCTE